MLWGMIKDVFFAFTRQCVFHVPHALKKDFWKILRLFEAQVNYNV